MISSSVRHRKAAVGSIVTVGSATLGSFAFQDIPAEQIERIEVVRGPRGSLYGSEAIGGVIQIFTRKGGGALEPYARVSAGSRHSFESSAVLSGGGERAWFNVSGSMASTRGFNACRGSLTSGCFVDEPDLDGYRNHSASLRAGYKLSDSAEVGLHALATSAENESDGGPFTGNRSDNRQRVVGAKLSMALMDPWQLTLRAGRFRDEGDSFKDALFVSEFVTRRDTFTWQNDFAIDAAQLLSVGFDWQRDGVDASVAYPVRSRWNRAVFAQYQGSFGDHDLDLALRHDRNQQFGSANTGSLAWGWRFHPGVRLVMSYGTAFKAPTFNELYFPFFGDPELDPEESRSIEAGLVGTGIHASWSVHVFRSRVSDLIGFDPLTFTAVNVGKARIRGIEATVATRVMDFDVNASATLLDPRNEESGPNKGNVLPRRPRQVVRVDVDRRFGRLGVGATVRAESDRFDDPVNNVRLGGFATWDLRAEYALAEAWLLQARVENLLDKRYETADDFNQAGRGAFVTLRYQP